MRYQHKMSLVMASTRVSRPVEMQQKASEGSTACNAAASECQLEVD
jgi:hypothetical protein